MAQTCLAALIGGAKIIESQDMRIKMILLFIPGRISSKLTAPMSISNLHAPVKLAEVGASLPSRHGVASCTGAAAGNGCVSNSAQLRVDGRA